MRGREGLLHSSARIVLYAGVGTLAAVCYQVLTASRVGEGAYLYSASYTIPVWLCGVAAAVAAVHGIRRVLPDRLNEAEGIEETEDFSEESKSVLPEIPARQPEPEDYFDTEPPDTNMEPELPNAAAARAEAIAKVFAQQRAETAKPEELSQSEKLSEEDSIWDLYQTVPQREETEYPHALYEDIPAELPEGYTAPQTGEWEESWQETADAEEDEWENDSRAGSLLWCIGRVICAAAFAVAAVVLASCFFVRADSEGVLVSRPWHTELYTWENVRSYTIDSTMIGSKLTVTLEFTDGQTAKLAPGSFSETRAFQDTYKSSYALMLSIHEKLEKAGASKTVQGREYLINAYGDREDGSWYYVAKIIGEPVE